MKVFIKTLVAFLIVGTSNIHANDQNSNQTYTYYDVGQKKTVNLLPNYVAEFSNNGNTQARSFSTGAVSPLIANAKLTDEGSTGVHIWKISDTTSTNTIQARNENTSSNLSPVFSNSGSLYALPGGVIVEFTDDQTPTQVENWAASHSYTIKTKLSFGNFYVINSPVGLETLTLANQLQESGEVVSATPDWWRQISKR